MERLDLPTSEETFELDADEFELGGRNSARTCSTRRRTFEFDVKVVCISKGNRRVVWSVEKAWKLKHRSELVALLVGEGGRDVHGNLDGVLVDVHAWNLAEELAVSRW